MESTSRDVESLKRFASDMPKAELHVHLEGTLEPELARKLAKRNAVPLNLPPETPDGAYPFHDLTSFLTVYFGAMSVLCTAEDFDDLTMNYLRQAHNHNVRHVEMFLDPQAHSSRGVRMETAVTGIRRAIKRAETEFGMSAALIPCFLRNMSSESAMETLSEALRLPPQCQDVIVGVGLDGDEKDNPPNKFAEVFQRVRVEMPSWRITVHCDIDQNNSIKHIRQAIDEIKVDRIDHGTNVVEDVTCVEKLKQRGIGLTDCPISNSIVCSKDFKKREIMHLLRDGVRVTVNSDDPAFFRGYVNENIHLLVSHSDISREEIAALQRNAFLVSWIPQPKRDALLQELDGFLSTHNPF